MHYKFFFIFVFLSTLNIHFIRAQSFRIFPSTVTQTEPIVSYNRSNPDLLFASAVTFNTITAFRSEGIYVSTDRGLTWFGSDTCSAPIIINHGGDPGVVVTGTNRLVITHMGSVFFGLYSHYSDDLGSSWTSAYTITGDQIEDKGTTVIDDSPTSPFNNNIYTAYVSFQNAPFKVYFARSTNNGQSWSSPQAINPNPLSRSSGPDLAIFDDGKIIGCWAGMTTTNPIREDFISIAISSDAGNTWIVRENVFDVNGIMGTLASKNNIRVNGLPRIAIDKTSGQFSGRIYIVTNEINNLPAGQDPDIILRYSDDLGNSWSNGVRVNQDAFNNGKIQYLPAITIDETGGINIIYYDDRTTSSDSAEVYLSRSTDGGNTWVDQQISGHKFKPQSIVGGASNYQGDFISIISINRKLYTYWMDNFSGIYQIWSSIIDISPNNIDVDIDEISNFKLFQNYPNPFNPSTKIPFLIAGKNTNKFYATLNIFDLLGRKIATLLNESITSGKYEVEFNTNTIPDLKSGIYFYQITLMEITEDEKMENTFSETGKMILLR
ncbi:exo-alpha-sialidase [Ignavibacterium sp.]|uniref:exo-alpha-sialidase n=1 Tax=Ignavibacterium sp. TaxID=2651167 RepID=UPI00307F9A7F